MDLYARARTSIRAWLKETPLPPAGDAHPHFQFWHQYDPNVQQWIPTYSDATSNDHPEPVRGNDPSNLVLLTWNIDAGASRVQERVTEILTYITQLNHPVDILFLQEVSHPALQQLLQDERIRGSWLSSEPDGATWNGRPFTTVTLLSKARLALYAGSNTHNIVVGPVWRVKFPSHFARDALCCDIFVPSRSEAEASCATRVRLVNVHLDSLPIKPSHRPRQISIVSSLLRAAGRGLVAGDFNPLLDEDIELLEFNGLTDAWTSLHPQEPGYTWGLDGQQPFPPNRLDKIGTLGLTASTIEILEPKRVGHTFIPDQTLTDDAPLWSDHHGLLLSFRLAEE
ncbi:endonuclease/exonuclease/phosphatase family protein [Aspergillus homomorphus CBS 101889]|uniref:Endonuclease/exonuclease/phosphatase domain-containing protein n=1 Tax=Aspergillus homomorphus (strain CBS 101889) TaxID=1450537 RepID=A0A395HKV1_ASPHC|nr:hypothetical protein BO97DRAFT_223334 [Aspergillus homomorphus CBS 101889]RAL08236.1 hypothetical protein BO97DRAFT_223334 [Aspergillus homomorphus CBS 101889]